MLGKKSLTDLKKREKNAIKTKISNYSINLFALICNSFHKIGAYQSNIDGANRFCIEIKLNILNQNMLFLISKIGLYIAFIYLC